MSIRELLKQAAKQVEGVSSEITTQIEVQSPDSAVLDVQFNGRMFVLDYQSDEGFGVDEFVSDRDGLTTGFADNFDDFATARDQLIELVKSAVRARAATLNAPVHN